MILPLHQKRQNGKRKTTVDIYRISDNSSYINQVISNGDIKIPLKLMVQGIFFHVRGLRMTGTNNLSRIRSFSDAYVMKIGFLYHETGASWYANGWREVEHFSQTQHFRNDPTLLMDVIVYFKDIQKPWLKCSVFLSYRKNLCSLQKRVCIFFWEWTYNVLL